MASTTNTGQPLTPFEEDALVCGVAQRLGMDVSRTESVRVTDEASLKRQGLMRSTPDYPKIRKLLHSGIPVHGAECGGYEYVLRLRREEKKEARNGDQDTADE